VLPDHRPGAGGRLAVEHVKRSQPDGSTILQIPGSVMTLYPHIHRNLRYGPLADFVPVTTLCGYVYSFTAGPGLPEPVRTVADYVGWTRANPGLASYGVPASGSPLHFAGMMLARAASVPLTAVPYRGGAPLLQDLLGGQVPVSFNVLTEVLPHVRAWRLRSLAVASAERSPFLPEVPTLVEQGYPDIALADWLGWFVPAGTPAETVRRLNAAVREALETPAFTETVLEKNGLRALHQSPEEFARLVRHDHERWGPVVRATGFTAED
jgi:tripartite-type tricarboxylate transporter receptor subunit TctC